MVTCKNCLHEIDDDLKYCPFCGTKVNEIPISENPQNTADESPEDNPVKLKLPPPKIISWPAILSFMVVAAFLPVFLPVPIILLIIRLILNRKNPHWKIKGIKAVLAVLLCLVCVLFSLLMLWVYVDENHNAEIRDCIDTQNYEEARNLLEKYYANGPTDEASCRVFFQYYMATGETDQAADTYLKFLESTLYITDHEKMLEELALMADKLSAADKARFAAVKKSYDDAIAAQMTTTAPPETTKKQETTKKAESTTAKQAATTKTEATTAKQEATTKAEVTTAKTESTTLKQSETTTSKAVSAQENETKKTSSVKLPKLSDVDSNEILAALKYLPYVYADLHDIKLNSFPIKSKALSHWMNDPSGDGFDENDTVYLDYKNKLFKGEQYSRTISFSIYTYQGQLKNNMPDGYGMLYLNDRIYYIGEFKDGYIYGYGLRVTTDMYYTQDLFHSVLGVDGSTITDSTVWMNAVYEGEFEYGRFSGKGNLFALNVDLDTVEFDEENNATAGRRYFDITVGEFKNGERDGDNKIYYDGVLHYDGEMKRGLYDGKGTLYFDDGSVMYSGKWKKGDYA